MGDYLESMMDFHLITAITQIIEVYIFGGLVFGYNTLTYILKSENLYSHVCPDSSISINQSNASFPLQPSSEVHGCNEQDLIFTSIFSVGICGFYITIFLGGILLDTYGLFWCRLIFFIATFVSALSLCLAHLAPELLWINAFTMGAQSAFAVLVSFPIANLYPARRALLTTMIGGIFDSSSTVLMFYQVIYDAKIAGLFTISLVYAIISIFIFIRTIWFVPTDNVPFILPEGYKVTQHTWWAKLCKSENENENKSEKADVESFCTSAARLVNIPYLWTGCFFYLINAFRQNMLVGSFGPWALWIENTMENESWLTLIFGIVGFAEIIFSILPGTMMDFFGKRFNRKWGVMICQLIATVLCGVLSGLMGIRSKTAAVASITLYYLFRTFTYGSLAVFAAECFPAHLFGTVNGLLTIAMMPATFAVPPIFSFMQESGHSFDFIAKVCIILSVLLLVHPLVLGLQLCKQRASNQIKPDVNELNSVQ